MADQQTPKSTFAYRFPADYGTTNMYEVQLEPVLFVALARVAVLIANNPDHFDKNFETMYNLARLGAFLEHGYVSEPLNNYIYDILRHFIDMAQVHHWKDEREPVLFLCYFLLAQKEITRQQAFDMAVRWLDVKAPKSANSWRVRVDKYANEKGFPPIGQSIRKPRLSYV